MISDNLANTYYEKNIEDINEEDNKVSFFGTVVNVEENTILVDNGKKAINIVFMNPIDKNIEKKHVKVYGKVIFEGDKVVIEGYFLQDMSNLSKKLYRKSKEILEKTETLILNEIK